MKTLKVFGERNTGTNYTIELLKLNFRIHILRGTFYRIPPLDRSETIIDTYFDLTKKSNLGWKHSKPDLELISARPDVNILILVKNPYSFLLSLHRRPYHNTNLAKLDFQSFLLAEWHCVKRENMSQKVPNPIELWNAKMKGYLECQDQLGDRVEIVRYEDLVVSPEKILEKIQTKWGLQPKSEHFINFVESTKKDQKSFTDYASYYKEEKWRSKLSSDDIELINKYLDVDIMGRLHYSKI